MSRPRDRPQSGWLISLWFIDFRRRRRRDAGLAGQASCFCKGGLDFFFCILYHLILISRSSHLVLFNCFLDEMFVELVFPEIGQFSMHLFLEYSCSTFLFRSCISCFSIVLLYKVWLSPVFHFVKWICNPAARIDLYIRACIPVLTVFAFSGRKLCLNCC